MYDKIAHYYDLTHDDLTEDVDYVLALVGKTAVSLLELGCGSGRLLLPLARAGHRVTGVDNSVAMLARAQTRLAAETDSVRHRVTLLAADMTQFDAAANAFEWAILPYNTFMHLNSAQMSAALARIHRGLAGNGRLFIDLINPAAMASTPNDRLLTLESTFTDPETGYIVVQQSSSRLDDDSQTLRITWLYDASPPAGGPIQRTIAQADYHYLYPHQLELLLHDAGFRLLSLSGGYDGEPYTEESERLLIVAEKQ